jgi:hypothetical protein
MSSYRFHFILYQTKRKSNGKMKRLGYFMLSLIIILSLPQPFLFAQMDNLHGDDLEYRMGVHSGNQFRTSFFNDGTTGGLVDQSGQVAGEWPIGSGHYYLSDGNIFIGSEITDTENHAYPIISENKGLDYGSMRGDKCGDDLHWCTFLPLPGFANPNSDRIAMNKWPDSWPSFWPDIADPQNARYSPDGWADAWNGYFGKNVYNADEESYYVIDDYENKEFFPDFLPDTTNLDRGGLGIRAYVRNFQWVYKSVDNVFFTLFDFESIGTYHHTKMVLGYKIGNHVGESLTDNVNDKRADYKREEDLIYIYDADNIGTGGWSPVGYMGSVFLESPGSPYDGIDNDNDGKDYSGPVVTQSMFQSKVLKSSDPIVIINYNTYERTVTTLAELNGRYTFTYNNQVYTFMVGDTVQEIGDNLIDDNLNGLIDENRGQYDYTFTMNYLYEGYKCIDYFSGSGADNLLIDERRDDGIDNNGNWNPEFDDTGADGLLPGHPDYPGPDLGENDGVPTHGEPHFDETDISETDMLGLTSFCLYDWTTLMQYDDNSYWKAMQPGLFIVDMTSTIVELLFGSGYFSMSPGQHQRLSLGLLFAYTLDELINIKHDAQLALNENYQLPKRPTVPKLTASTCYKQVILSWDDAAEKSYDPVLGSDFEGYRIYKSTDPLNPFEELIAQFDLDNDYSGYSKVPVNGESFWLGSNTDLRHFYVDKISQYGYDYYYTVTSYDHGDVDLAVPPSECLVGISVDDHNDTYLLNNSAVVRPVAPDAGRYSNQVTLVSGITNGMVQCEIVDPSLVRSGHTYRITFEDTLRDNFYYLTKDFTLTDITANEVIINKSVFSDGVYSHHVGHGFRLSLQNSGDGELGLNESASGWSQAGIPDFEFVRYMPSPSTRPVRSIVSDFKISFAEVGVDTSKLYYLGTIEIPSKPVNFTVINTLTNEKVPFAFRERAGDDGIFSFDLLRRRSDEIILLANPDPDNLVASWAFRCFIESSVQADSIRPGPGTYVNLILNKPFLAQDVFEFTMPEILPAKFSLCQNYPNPFNSITTFNYELPQESKVTLSIFDLRGRLVETIVNQTQPAGYYSVLWNAEKYSSGVYLYRFQAGDFRQVRKCVVIK